MDVVNFHLLRVSQADLFKAGGGPSLIASPALGESRVSQADSIGEARPSFAAE